MAAGRALQARVRERAAQCVRPRHAVDPRLVRRALRGRVGHPRPAPRAARARRGGRAGRGRPPRVRAAPTATTAPSRRTALRRPATAATCERSGAPRPRLPRRATGRSPSRSGTGRSCAASSIATSCACTPARPRGASRMPRPPRSRRTPRPCDPPPRTSTRCGTSADRAPASDYDALTRLEGELARHDARDGRRRVHHRRGPRMTATRVSAGAPGTEAGADSAAAAVTPTLRETFRRRRAWIVIAVVLVLGALVVLIVQGGARAPGPILGADNPAPPGSKALVQVLRAHGVDVLEARTAEAAIDAATAGATVFLYDEAGILGSDRLDELAAAADRLVVAEPGFGALEALAPGVRLAGAASGPIDDVACTAGPAEQAESLSGGQRLLTVDDAAAAAGWRGCFRDGEFGYALVTGPGASGGEVALVGRDDRVRERARRRVGQRGARDRPARGIRRARLVPAGAGRRRRRRGAPTLAELTPGWVSPVHGARDRGRHRRRRLARSPLRAARRREAARAGARRRDERGTGTALRAQRVPRARTRPAPHRRDRPHRRRAAAAALGAASRRSRTPRRTRPGATRHPWHGSSSAPARPATASSSTSPPSSTGSSTRSTASVRPATR